MKKQTDPPEDAGGWDITSILRTLSADIVRLVVVEARLLRHTVLAMVALTLVITLLLLAAWLFAGVAAVMALATLQAFSLTGALLTVALAHLVLAALVFWRLKFIARDLRFRESWASVNSLLVLARTLVGAAGQRPPDK